MGFVLLCFSLFVLFLLLNKINGKTYQKNTQKLQSLIGFYIWVSKCSCCKAKSAGDSCNLFMSLTSTTAAKKIGNHGYHHGISKLLFTAVNICSGANQERHAFVSIAQETSIPPPKNPPPLLILLAFIEQQCQLQWLMLLSTHTALEALFALGEKTSVLWHNAAFADIKNLGSCSSVFG